MVKKIWFFISLMMLSLALVGCSCPFAAAPGGGGAKTPELAIGLMPDIDSIPFIIAKEKGFFAEEGVAVHLQPFKSAMDRDAALQSGNLDGAVSDLLAAAFAKEGGFEVRVTSKTDGNYCLVAAKQEAPGLQSLAGKEIGLSKNTIIEYVTDQILLSQGMAEGDVAKAAIPQISARLELLQQGKLASATLPEPLGSIAVHNGGHCLSSARELGIHPGVMLFTKDAIENKKTALQAVYRAYNKAVRYLREAERAEYIDLVVEKSGFPAVAKEVLVLPPYQEAKLPAEQDVSACMAWLKERQLIKQPYGYKDIVAEGLGL